MNRGVDHMFGIPHDVVKFFGAVIGAGAAAPTRCLNGQYTPTTATYPARANGVSTTTIPTRTSAGLYTITLTHQIPTLLFGTASVLSGGGAPTAALVADVLIMNPVVADQTPSGFPTITVLVSTPAGIATDLGTSDMLVFELTGQNSLV